MTIIQQPSVLRAYINNHKKDGKTIGFVPTMGALHEGHLSLVSEAKQQSEVTVCSIFVNPTQFNDPGDYEKYPVTLNDDIRVLENAGNNILFLPSASTVYPDGTSSLEHYDIGYLETVLEGQYRPGHFQGVCQVMSRLLGAVNPDLLFMGRKDYQQCMVIKRLIEILEMPTEMIACPTLREQDGLAMSSRNRRFSPDQCQKAATIYQALLKTQSGLKPGNLGNLKKEAATYLKSNGFRVDYFEITSAHDFRIVEEWDGREALVALVAAFLGEVRLIDNMQLND